jgi:hypothetical protein
MSLLEREPCASSMAPACNTRQVPSTCQYKTAVVTCKAEGLLFVLTSFRGQTSLFYNPLLLVLFFL